MKCSQHTDCEDIPDLAKPKCEKGRCVRKQWCPAEDLSNQKTAQLLSEDAVGDYVIWFQSHVHFHKFNVDVSTTDAKFPIIYPEARATAYPVRDILHFAGVPFNDTSHLGAVILANLNFKCDLDSKDCTSRMQASFVDASTGYNYAKPHYYVGKDGQRWRDLHRYYGLIKNRKKLKQIV